MSKPNQSTTEKTVDRAGSTIIERVKYKLSGTKPTAPVPPPKNTTNDALGAQSIKMRDEADHKALQNAGVAWQRHQAEEKKRWLDWTEILGPALLKVQKEAMAIASTNKPKGRRYSKAVSGLLKTYQLDRIDGATRSNAIKIVQNLEAVTAWRSRQEKLETLNHPSTVWRWFTLSDDWRAIQMQLGITPKERQSSPKPKKRRATLENGLARVDEKPCLEKSPPDPGESKENDGLLGLPDFLNRTPRGALATLLATRKLTVDDVPTDTRPAALRKLANELFGAATALEKRRSAEDDRGEQRAAIISSEGLA